MAKKERDLDQKYRPTKLADVVGQDNAVKVILGWKDSVPRAILLSGSTGVGKSTTARILARSMGISAFDLNEINCGVVESSIDMVRGINAQMTAAPMSGGARMWILDEVQTLSRQKYAQEALLKVLEDCPDHVHFALCTTDPQRLLAAIRGRCVHLALRPLKPAELETLVSRVATAEGIKVGRDALDRIVAGADGSARNALKALELVAGIESEEEQAEAAAPQAAVRHAHELTKALIPFGGAPNWAEAVKVLTDCRDEDPESIRQIVLAGARTTLLKHGSKGAGALAYRVISCLETPFYDRASGHALLAAGVYRICFAK